MNDLECMIYSQYNTPDVLCLTEHWLTKSEAEGMCLDGWYMGHAYTRTNLSNGGSMILVNQSGTIIDSPTIMKIRDLSLEIHCEISAIKLKLNKINFVVVCIYSAPSRNFRIFIDNLETLLDIISVYNENVFLCGDLNIRFDTGTSFVPDREAKTFLNLLTSFGFKQKIFQPTRNNNCLDNIFTNFDAQDEYADVIPTAFSDHDAQILSARIPNKLKPYKYIKLRPLTAEGFFEMHGALQRRDWGFIYDNTLGFEARFSMFHQNIVEDFVMSFPEKKLRVQDTRADIGWFTREIRDIRENLLLINSMYQYYASSDLREHRNKLRLEYRKAIKRAKLCYYNSKIESSDNKSKAAWRIINGYIKDGSKRELANIDADSFGAHFATVAQKALRGLPQTNVRFDETFRKQIPPGKTFSFQEVGQNVVRDIVRNIKNSNSADYYGLSIKVVKRNINSIISPLTKLINEGLITGKFPKCLKVSKVIPVFKKGDKNDVNNYRPISLVPVFSKVLEKVMSTQIVAYLECNNLLTDRQFGFREGRNTVEAIIDFVNSTVESFENKDHRLASFVDLTKAFDCVPHDKLLEKLKRYGFDDRAMDMMASFLSERYQIVSSDGTRSQMSPINMGVVQGSVLGPVLFLVYINDLPDYIPEVEATLFVDDTTVAIRDVNSQTLLERSRIERVRLVEWFTANGLSVNEEKTYNMIMTLRPFDGEDDMVHSVKFLGVHVDSALTWSSHIDNLLARLSRNIFALRTLSFSLTPDMLRAVYFALVESHLKYGVLLWGDSAGREAVFRLQRRAIRVLGGLGYRDCCRNAFKDLGILTFPSLFILESVIYIHKNKDKYVLQSDIHGYGTRNKSLIRKDFLRLSKSQRAPGFRAVSLYNKLPGGLKNLRMNVFKIKIKKMLTLKVFYSIDEFYNMTLDETDLA